jgi:electron transport complex protein RnfG
MRDKIWYMVLVLFVVGLTAGLSLAAVKQLTDPLIEGRTLDHKVRPALEELLHGLGIDNDPVADRIKLQLGKDELGRTMRLTVFNCKKGDDTVAVALQTSGAGFAGDIEVLTVIEVETKKILGARALSFKETKGLGSRVGDANEPFVQQFSGLDGSLGVRLSQEGGRVDAMTGATVSSAAFTSAVSQALRLLDEKRAEILGTEARP